MQLPDHMADHLSTGVTTLCRCWRVIRRDGVTLGFTDHDRALRFGGVTFLADTGLSASTLQQATGLSIDNAEALGGLSAAQVSDADIEAGRYDGAAVTCWLVNWTDVSQRAVLFQGHFGDLERAGGAFRVELRGLTDQLNTPLGRSFIAPCAAVLGDQRCRFDTAAAGYSVTAAVREVESGSALRFAPLNGFEAGWFQRGHLRVVTGAAAGALVAVKGDEAEEGGRLITLWEPLKGGLQSGDQVTLTAGCDKAFQTCRLKFNNVLNYQGFPDMPGDDWLMAHPAQAGQNSGGSRR
ncbi:DUF2163 domain-containing protein [Thalassobius sp. Cn5-15]|uniref:DUF2163 domain-containing protein n=1 Tax=Thalassobius sp. Cn5-15 TaxID=2917763 RepID=UPI001EF3984F|nr:DUF2163 domain-containing protein [Thalassobius sp. Cn5-15]MCG7492078.1 DUF2163 domain-containing protein [Thalassobius sp. Cn5-15]